MLAFKKKSIKKKVKKKRKITLGIILKNEEYKKTCCLVLMNHFISPTG